MEPIVSKSLPVSLNQHRSHGPIFFFIHLGEGVGVPVWNQRATNILNH